MHVTWVSKLKRNCLVISFAFLAYTAISEPVDISKYKQVITSESGKHYIWIEAEKADRIEPSFEIEESPECSGGKYLSHPEDSGSAWAKTTVDGKEIPCGIGLAEYTIEIPADGEYAFWGRVKWESGCSDSFFLSIDDQKPEWRKDVFIANKFNAESFDKDTTHDTWHWASCQIFQLSKGKHRLALKNQDDGSHIDKMLLTNDLSFKPQGLAEWTYASSFESGSHGGWYLDEENWKIKKDKTGNSLLEKTSAKTSPAFLQNLNSPDLYFSATIINTGTFFIWLRYDDMNNYLRIVCDKKQIFLEECRNSQVNILLKNDMPVVDSSLKYELFKEAKRLTVVINNKVVLKSDMENLKDIARIGVDFNQGGGMRNVFLSPMENIHLGENLYLAWLINFNVARGKWKASSNSLSPDDDGSGLLISGEGWWKDYQMVFLAEIPDTGSAGAVFCYRDDKNFYCLSLSKNIIVLYRVKNGKSEVLASSARKGHELPPPASKAVKADPKNTKDAIASPETISRQRVTINRVKSDIQVFFEGKKLFQVADAAFYSGKAGFFSEKATGFSVDDMEIASIESTCSSDSNESVAWFKNHECRIINSQMDSFGATGGFHPGDYHQERKEDVLSNITKGLAGKDIGNIAQILDFQWLSFDTDAFKEHHGMWKESGFIIGQSFKDGDRKYLWSSQNLFGDWNFSYKITGKAKAVGVVLVDPASGAGRGKQFVFSYDSATGMLRESPGLKSASGKYDWKAEEWQKVSIERTGKSLSCKIGGKTLGSYEDVPDSIVLRPAIFYENGTVFLDNITAYAKPSLFYDFDYNQPWSLALSDWEYSGKLSNGGGYYSYLILGDEKNLGWMRSKRLFSGDLAVMVVVELDKTNKLEIGLEDEKGQRRSFEATRDAISFKAGNVIKKTEKLLSFSSDQRRMSTILLLLNKGTASVYLSDAIGTQRLVFTQDEFWQTDIPFKLNLSGSPMLEVQKIMIWGKEK